MAHNVKNPDRTAYRYLTLNLREPDYKVWKTRDAMARAIRKQENKSPSNQDWIPVVTLTHSEGY